MISLNWFFKPVTAEPSTSLTPFKDFKIVSANSGDFSSMALRPFTEPTDFPSPAILKARLKISTGSESSKAPAPFLRPAATLPKAGTIAPPAKPAPAPSITS